MRDGHNRWQPIGVDLDAQKLYVPQELYHALPLVNIFNIIVSACLCSTGNPASQPYLIPIVLNDNSHSLLY